MSSCHVQMAMTTLIYFTNDLRVSDNPLLNKAVEINQPLLCVYCLDRRSFEPSGYDALRPMGKARWQFLYESLTDLREQLNQYDQQLHIIFEEPENCLPKIIEKFDVSTLLVSRQFGWMENKIIDIVVEKSNRDMAPKGKSLHHLSLDSYSIFKNSELPHQGPFPSSFSKFKKQVQNSLKIPEHSRISFLPQQPTHSDTRIQSHLPECTTSRALFKGGEQHGQAHVNAYFDTRSPSSYKDTRNALDGWFQSCKFSPWLASGTVSVHYILRALKDYEQSHGRNDSTEWIYFELLWREYFQWYANHYQERLFAFSGISHQKPLTSFYPQRFRLWCEGQTPWPIVNACMNELNTTGYLSNRGRQIVASCLVNELQLDWRYGAAYFQQQLVDYDVAVNWGNWQYIAGVGADPRGGRHFNLEKQTALYDPDATYIQKWCPAGALSTYQGVILDSVDAADWPIS